jgi:hypothetical protein
MPIGSVMAVYQDGEGWPPFYIVNLEGVGEGQTEGERLLPVTADSPQGPTHPVHHAPPPPQFL